MLGRIRCLTHLASAGLLFASGLLLLPAAPKAQEGWDPLKQVTSQMTRPNLLIVLDVSGSMAWSPTSDSDQPGVDSFGLPTLSFSVSGPTKISSGCSGGNKKYMWTFTLTTKAKSYSRMDAFKNALGNSVPLYTYTSIPWPTQAQGWPTSHTNHGISYVYIGGGQWTWTSDCESSQPNDPPKPFSPEWTVPDYSASPALTAQVDGWTLPPSIMPQDLVGRSKGKVNWGLEIFSTGLPSKFGSGNAFVIQPVKADDTQATQDAVVAAIEPYLKPNYYSPGLKAYNSTATSSALNLAKKSLNYTYTSTNPEGGVDSAAGCGRFYGVVLVTDGASNTCNPGGGYQGCDSSPPSDWAKYPEGRTDELFLETADGSSGCSTDDQSPVPVRTFVIGVSTSVSRCELNLDAYMGRTDASSPNGDSGVDIAKDVDSSGNFRLPLNVPYAGPTAPLTQGTSTATDNYRSVTAGCTSGCADYAHFATDSTALYNAFTTIIASAGSGDYSMSAPVVSTNILNSGSISYISSMTYPAMQGHLYAYDVSQCYTKNCTLPSPTCSACTGTTANPTPAPLIPALLWDAGKALAERDLTSSPRVLLTWDPADPTAKPIDLFSKNWGSLSSSIKTMLGNNENVLWFLRGYAGTPASPSAPPVKRTWLLGPIINSTAGIVGAPQIWEETGALPSHKPFEVTYSLNHPMIMVGSSDGMLHFFDVADGAEVLAVMPPDQLAHQVTLYNNYVGGATATGEPRSADQHIFGVASSPRFADIYFTSDNTYHTELLLTEGPGGRSLTALDITHPYPGRTGVVVPYVDGKNAVTQIPIVKTKTLNYIKDANYSATSPVSVFWYKDGALASGTSSYAKLGQTWSVPAMGCTAPSATSPTSSCVMGSGYSDYSTNPATPVPELLLLDATSGAEKTSQTLNTGSGLVKNQAYGAGVLFNQTAASNKPNDKLSLGLVSDTNGNVYGVDPASTTMTTLFSSGSSQPIYYTPAVGYYSGWDIYAYAAGNFYEKSTAVTGLASTFEPYVFVTLKDPTGVKSDVTVSAKISSFTYCSDPPDCKSMKAIPKAAQPTADPLLFLPANAAPDPSSPVKAYFVFYDPDPSLGCGGASFLVKLSVDLSQWSGGKPASSASAASLGSGAASGIAFSGGQIIVAKSALGQGAAAAPASTGEKAPNTIGQTVGIGAWVELQ